MSEALPINGGTTVRNRPYHESIGPEDVSISNDFGTRRAVLEIALRRTPEF